MALAGGDPREQTHLYVHCYSYSSLPLGLGDCGVKLECMCLSGYRCKPPFASWLGGKQSLLIIRGRSGASYSLLSPQFSLLRGARLSSTSRPRQRPLCTHLSRSHSKSPKPKSPPKRKAAGSVPPPRPHPLLKWLNCFRDQKVTLRVSPSSGRSRSARLASPLRPSLRLLAASCYGFRKSRELATAPLTGTRIWQAEYPPGI